MRTLTLCAACARKYAGAYRVEQAGPQHYGKCGEQGCRRRTMVALYEVKKK